MYKRQQTITRLTDALAAAQQTAAAAQALHAGTIQQPVSYTHLDVYKRQIQQQLLTGEAGADQQDQAPEQKRGWFSKLFRG